jgi:hypothetical protein
MICAIKGRRRDNMARPKKKPNYDAEKIMDEFTASIIDCFGRKYDDRVEEEPGLYPSLNSVAAEFGITVIKTRKILITAGYYSTATSRKIAELLEQGYTVNEIMAETGLKYAAVQAYLPYSKKIYKLDELSTNAERTKLYRERKDICRRIADAETVDEDMLLEAVAAFQNFPFHTSSGQSFSYVFDAGSKAAVIYGKKESKAVSWNVLTEALYNTLEGGNGDFDTYIHPMFTRFGII